MSMFVWRNSGRHVLSTWYIKCSTIVGIAVDGTGGSPASVAAGGGAAGHVGPRSPEADTTARAACPLSAWTRRLIEAALIGSAAAASVGSKEKRMSAAASLGANTR
jgi:hypothetical protein